MTVTGGILHNTAHFMQALSVCGRHSKVDLHGVAVCLCEHSGAAQVWQGGTVSAVDCCCMPDGAHGMGTGMDLLDISTVSLVRPGIGAADWFVSLVKASNQEMLYSLLRRFCVCRRASMHQSDHESASHVTCPTLCAAVTVLACRSVASSLASRVLWDWLPPAASRWSGAASQMSTPTGRLSCYA